MKNYTLVSSDCLIKMSKCFSSSEEVTLFLNHLNDMLEELAFQRQLTKRVDEETSTVIILKQICIISFFFREHLELIHQLMSCIESKSITEQEMQKLKDNNETDSSFPI